MDNFLGEIRVFGFGKLPIGWLPCDGRMLSIQTNQALFALIGIQYGGDGVKNFALPDLRGKTMLTSGRAVTGTNYVQGKTGGEENVKLSSATVPGHTHTINVMQGVGTKPLVAGNYATEIPGIAGLTNENINSFVSQTQADGSIMLYPETIASSGGAIAHVNRMPYLSLQLCIATTGVWPPRD